jgi:hypothetical protein
MCAARDFNGALRVSTAASGGSAADLMSAARLSKVAR